MAAIIHLCEHCHKSDPDLIHVEVYDEYWCQNCLDNRAEAAYDSQQDSLMESPPESSREEHLRTWAEHQTLHRR